ncbi:hypothetical protein [Streptomyces sp. NPDC058620]|uniref:hypothetical protein n=1 Tax=Streptomyces sp. NPDC058620 TaxID=3346560 RepID=UPI00365DADAF
MSDTTSQTLADVTAERDQLLALLQVVANALDVPPPATVGDQAAYQRLLEERADHVRRSVAAVLSTPDNAAFDTEYLARLIARTPVTYTTYESAEDDNDTAEPTEDAEDSETAAQRVTVTPSLLVAKPATVAACQADYASASGTAARDAMARQAAARARHS